MDHPESWAVLKWTPLKILWGGHQAVILFFVLSGFSLFVMMEKTSHTMRGIAGYAAARIIRLYPTYIASLSLVGALLWLIKPGFSPSVGTILSHFGMVGEFDFNAINPPIWSIVHEMRISLIFPLLFLSIVRWPGATVVTTLLSSMALAVVLWTESRLQHLLVSGYLSYAMTTHYTTMFAVGAVVARFRKEILARLQDTRPGAAFIILALALYMYPFDNPWNMGQRFAGDLGIMAGAVGLILFALRNPALFVARPLQYLGRISYSLYLTHFACVSAVLWVVGKEGNSTLIWAGSIMLAIPAAHLVNVVVEQRSQAWSRRIRT
jgi:peptidoglycan/LPS O-acetylase OafA/YrhL